MPERATPALTGDDRCWPCTIANSVVGLIVAAIPVFAAVVRGEPVLIGLALVWAAVVIGYTFYRLLARGYLPYAETIARRMRLHHRIGPGRKD